jgi:hypothetical protein
MNVPDQSRPAAILAFVTKPSTVVGDVGVCADVKLTPTATTTAAAMHVPLSLISAPLQVGRARSLSETKKAAVISHSGFT